MLVKHAYFQLFYIMQLICIISESALLPGIFTQNGSDGTKKHR